MTDYSSSTPGVYVKEIAVFPPSVAEVETAIPAFIGFTEKGYDANNMAVRITNLLEYEQLFGRAPQITATITLDKNLTSGVYTGPTITVGGFLTTKFIMYYSLQMYFANGGGPCYIVSVGSYLSVTLPDDTSLSTAYEAGLAAISKKDEPTILVFPDAKRTYNTDVNYYSLMKDSLAQCAQLQDRVAIIDVEYSDTIVAAFRDNIGNNIDNLKYGAAYTPFLNTVLKYHYDEANITVVYTEDAATPVEVGSLYGATTKLSEIIAGTVVQYPNQAEVYNRVKTLTESSIAAMPALVLPPSSSVAGVYASVDSSRGVWKAPANVSLNYVVDPSVKLTDGNQSTLNIDATAGKSINAIRAFTGKGTLVWGARTLAGNDNEWRYISVRRFFNFAEESVRKSTGWVVFEPNDANTWARVKSMIDGFLTKQWRAGALVGEKPENAFFVKVGLGETMTQLDILEGTMNIEIGMAVVRPSEFIILKFSHKMQES